MAKYLYVRTASNDAAIVAIDKITDCALDGDWSLHIGFTTDDNSTAGVIECTVNTSDALEKTVLLDLANALVNTAGAVFILRDDVTAEGLANVTAVGTITPSS